MKKNEIKELSQVVKDFSTEEILVIAFPGTLTNNGKQVNAIEVTVQHKPTKKSQGFIYRGETSNFRNFMKEAVDALTNEIHREIIKESSPKLSL